MYYCITKQKQKEKISEKPSEKSNLKDIAKVLAVSFAGLFGRVMFQSIPSVEPLLALAIITSFYKGPKYWLPMALSYVAANSFMIGGQGFWSIAQFMGVLFAGIFASFKRGNLFKKLLGGAIIYELFVNSLWLPLFISPFILLSSLPFSIVHITSTIGFGAFFESIRGKENE